jgi:hypothetical protein
MIIFVAALLLTEPAAATVQELDFKNVTTISEAARLCGLTEAGIAWAETSDNTLSILVQREEMLPELIKRPEFAKCFFPWTFGTSVTISLGLTSDKK